MSEFLRWLAMSEKPLWYSAHQAKIFDMVLAG